VARELISYGKDISDFLPPHVKLWLNGIDENQPVSCEKWRNRNIVIFCRQ
jgi:hypothetical protein